MNSTPVNSTPVTVVTGESALGATTTTSYNTTYNSTYTTTTPYNYYTLTYTTTYTVTSASPSNACSGQSGNHKVSTTVTTYTSTYTNYYVSSTSTPYQTTTSTTTSTVTGPLAGTTVLERSYIPNDGHSFAKFYNGGDLPQLTPFSSAQTSKGITLCNTTVSSTTYSQNVTDPPLIRVAAGNFMLWNANERWQCRWIGEENTYNNQLTTLPYDNAGIFSATNPPSGTPPSQTSNSLGLGDYVARVLVCNISLLGNETCKAYSSGSLTSFKPIGLLQTYGDTNELYFGLLTGSYGKNKSGGVLRKNVSTMNNEINLGVDGTFISNPSGGGIIQTLNSLRIYGYKHSDGTYFNSGSMGYPSTLCSSTSCVTDGSANCIWGLTSYPDGSCSNWGNPQAEMYLESLRYLADFSATSAYLPTSPNLDSFYISRLNVATTTVSAGSPTLIPSAQWCSNMSLINFNASSTSYDGDQLSGISDLGTSSVSPLTDSVGTGENIPGNNFFVGSNGTNNNQLCTAKTVSSLSGVSGICPDAPRLSGTYQIDGLAWYGHTNDLISNLKGSQTVTTYGVALAPKLPVVTVPVPGSTNNVTIIPACQDTSLPGNCTQIDFKIITQLSNQTAAQCNALVTPISASYSLPAGTYNCGTLYVNWEDSEQGGDFDMDMWGPINYAVSAKQVYITTKAVYQSTPYAMGLGYVISGTKNDGFHAHAGINGYAYSDPNPGTLVIQSSGTGAHPYCTGCYYTDNLPTTVSYNIGATSAASLQQPLWYAAKWGGFVDYNHTGTPNATADWDANGDGIPDHYYYATNPASLASSLAQAFNQVIGANAAASSAAANSGNLQTSTVLYQAEFSSSNWSGHLFDISLLSTGVLSASPNWDAATQLPAATARNIYTYNGSAGAPFEWPTGTQTTLSASQMQALQTSLSGVLGSSTVGQQRLNWIRGDQSNEVQNNGYLRNRTDLLGDIIDSNPVYTQAESYGYSNLPVTAPEQASYANYLASKSTRTAMIYDGANDGMLHGFNANTGVEQFAYVPAAVYGQLSGLTDPQYTHKYFVDGTASISDAYVTKASSSKWTTVLVSGLNKGGQSVFALDVSNPTAFSAANVLWEYSGSTSDTGSTGVTDVNGMGYSYAQPQVAKMNDGSWAAIFGNGYDSVSGEAFLYIVNLNTGALVKKIPTNSTVSNGLSTAVLYDANNDSVIDYAYAGDLQGNLWKFDLTATSSAGWVLSNGGQPLFSAVNSNNQIQPITSKPLLAANPMGGVMVYFGTGSYLTLADANNTNTQSFYAIWDKPSTTGTVGLANLVQQSITETVNSGTTNPAANCPQSSTTCSNTYTNNLRSVSGLTVDYSKERGWYLDLTPGERVRSAPVLINSLVLFLTTIPSTDPCVPGGTSWLMEVNYLSGGAPAVSPFDLSNEGVINSSDVLPNGAIATGVQSTVGLVAGTVFVGTGSGKTNKYNYGSTSQTQIVTNYSSVSGSNNGKGSAAGTVNRNYWLQIQ